MTIDLEQVARYPANDDQWLQTVLIGGVLTLLAPLILPAFLLYGYLLRVLRAGMSEAAQPPVFDDWGTLLREGVVAVAVALIYQLIPLVVLVVTVGGAVAALGTGSEVGASAGIIGIISGVAVSALLALVFGYLMLIGLANYAHVGEFGAAFDVDVIWSVAVDGDYAVPWLYGVGILFVASALAGILGLIPILGAIVGVFVTFYGQVAAGWVWGKGFADAAGIGGERTNASAADEPTLGGV